MISCRNVAKLLTTDELAAQSWWKRMEVRLHLLLCEYCSRLARQIEQLSAAARGLSASRADFDSDLEARILRKLSGSGR